jgi:hypothetical protein
MKKVLLILILLTGFMAWQSCQYDWIEAEPIDPDQPVSFSGQIVPIFEAKCNAGVCHGDGGKDPILTANKAFDSLISGGFVDTTAPENSGIYISMASGGSMSNYCTKADADLVLIWLQQGAQDN